jgi:diguanylate cyclase (GGDEF)-like protein
MEFGNFIRVQEQTQLQKDSDSLWQYMQSEIQNEESQVEDWAIWDDSYSFVQNKNDTYIQKNINEQSVGAINQNLMIYFDKQCNPVYNVYYDEENNKISAIPGSLLQALRVIVSEGAPYNKLESFFYHDTDGYYNIALSPITDSLGKEPADGYLLMGNKFNMQEITKMDNIAGAAVIYSPLNDLDGSLVEKIVTQPILSNGLQVLSKPESNSLMDTYIMPPVDSIGSPMVVIFSKPRAIYQNGLKQLLLTMFLFLATFVAIILVLIWALNKHITNPISRMMKAIAGLHLSSEKIGRLPVKGSDELAELGGTINQMIDKVEQNYENAMQFGYLVSRMKQGLVVFDAITGPHCNIEGFKLAYSNDSFEKQIGRDPMVSELDIITQADPRKLERLHSVVLTGSSIVYEVSSKELDKSFEIVAYRPKPMRFAAIVTDITERKLIENERQYTSYHDQLTGLYNRRYFDETLVGFDTQKFLPLSVIIGDLNGLKLTNDAFGHHIGDALLVAVAEALTAVCRKQDIIARWGGDEFIVLLPKTTQKETGFVCERINKAVSQIEINSLMYSISLGYETKAKPEESFSEVMKKAEDYMYRKKIIASHSGRGQAINAILTTFKENNPREKEHSNRVSHLCRQIGRSMSFGEEQLNDLEILGLVHDIGKIAISDTIINKVAKLTSPEWEELKRHPEIGYRILCSAANMQTIAEYVLYHHERWDGSGYPKAVKGPEIPVQARILSVADAFDAMTSERPYKKSLSVDEAVEEIKRMAGSQFDPKIARVFVEDVLGRKWAQPEENVVENAG